MKELIDIRRTRKNISALTFMLRATPPPRHEDISQLPPENVLILSPHPDDEIIGCGGTMIKHKHKGSNVFVTYLTDGRKGSKTIDPVVLTEIRREEAKAGLKKMGCSEHIFMDYPDGRLCEYMHEGARELTTIIADFRPDTIFVPNFLDAHYDHAATATILAMALKKEGRDIMCYSYEVWTSVIPNTIVDISDVMITKLDALREHKSQLAQIDFVKKVEGLNSYRSIYFGDEAGYCEAFLRTSRKEYVRILRYLNHPAISPSKPQGLK